MLWILSAIIILYLSSHLIFGKNPTFIKVRKWVDIATLIVISILVITWIEIFNYPFLFIVYLCVSAAAITYLTTRLKKAEEKKQKAEQTIQVLKDKEELLEERIEEETQENVQK